jgi:hypothetical protein
VTATTCIVFFPLMAIQVRIVCHRLVVSTISTYSGEDLLSETKDNEVYRESTLILPNQC